MKIPCPAHDGAIRIGQTHVSVSDVKIKNLVVECPACDEEVLINGTYDFDSSGFGTPKDR